MRHEHIDGLKEVSGRRLRAAIRPFRRNLQSQILVHFCGHSAPSFLERRDKMRRCVSCNCSKLHRCPTDRAAVFMVTESTEDVRAYTYQNSPDRVDVPDGFRLLCHAAKELSSQLFGCDLSSEDNIYKSLSAEKAQSVCSYGTVALSMRDRHIPNASFSIYCLHHQPCPKNKVLYYDVKTRKGLCLSAGQSGSTVRFLKGNSLRIRCERRFSVIFCYFFQNY